MHGNANAPLNFTGMFHTRWSGRILIVLRLSTCAILCIRRTISLFVVNTPLSKLEKVIDLKAHFPVVSIIFRRWFFFKSWQSRVRVDDRVLMIRIRFSCALRLCDIEVFDGDLMPSKNEAKDLHVQRQQKNAIDQAILATSKT